MQNEHRSIANSKGRNDEQGNEIRHLYLFCPRYVIKFLCRLNELIYIYIYINARILIRIMIIIQGPVPGRLAGVPSH